MQFQLWKEAKEMAQEIFNDCIHVGIGGYYNKVLDVPGYGKVRLVVVMKSKSRYTYQV